MKKVQIYICCFAIIIPILCFSQSKSPIKPTVCKCDVIDTDTRKVTVGRICYTVKLIDIIDTRQYETRPAYKDQAPVFYKFNIKISNLDTKMQNQTTVSFKIVADDEECTLYQSIISSIDIKFLYYYKKSSSWRITVMENGREKIIISK